MLNLPATPGLDCLIGGSLHSVQKLRCGNGGNDRRGLRKLPEKGGHIEAAPFICDQQRAIEDHSH